MAIELVVPSNHLIFETLTKAIKPVGGELYLKLVLKEERKTESELGGSFLCKRPDSVLQERRRPWNMEIKRDSKEKGLLFEHCQKRLSRNEIKNMESVGALEEVLPTGIKWSN